MLAHPWQEEEARPSHEADSPTPSFVRLAASFVHLRMAEEARLENYHGQRTLLCRFPHWLSSQIPFLPAPTRFHLNSLTAEERLAIARNDA